MKIICYLVAAALAAFFAINLCSCVETTTTAPDGTVTRTKAPAPGSLELAGQAITVIGARKIEATK